MPETSRPRNRSSSSLASVIVGAAGSIVAAAALLTGCPSDDTGTRDPQRYQKMVNAFYSGVVALSANDPDRAHTNLKTATELYPNEAAAWANLGVSYLRAAKLKEAGEALERARKLAPDNAEILVTSALWEDAQGSPEKAAQHLRKAAQLDPANIRAQYLLAKQLERLAAPGSDAEIEALYARIVDANPENLIVLVELSRRAARDGAREKLQQRLEQLAAVSGGWPADVKERLQDLVSRAGTVEPRSLAVGVQMLGNVLKATRQYQPSVAALGAGDAKTVGTPIERFLTLRQPVSTPSPRDETLTFAPEPLAREKAAWAVTRLLQPETPQRAGGAAEGAGASTGSAGASAASDASPTLVYPRATGIALEGGPVLPFPGAAAPAGPHGALSVDWNDDFRPDFVLAGPKGVRLFQQSDAGKWTDVTAKSGIPAAVAAGAYAGAWAADVDLDGDLDVVLGPSVKPGSAAEPVALRNNGDGTWGTERPFAGVSGATDLVWADLDGNAAPDVALLDGSSQLALFLNQRGGHYKKADLKESGGKALALSVADADQNGTLDLVVLRPGGAIQSVSSDAQSGWKNAELANWDQAPASGPARVLTADLDNNGALDLIASGPGGTNLWLADEQLKLQPLNSKLDARVFAAEDLTDDGRLDLVGVSMDGRPVRLVNAGGKSYHWQGIRPRNASAKDGDQKINAFGIGGQVGLRAGMLVQTQPIIGPKMHFGLGEQSAANVVRITWPNGQFQGEFDLAADHSPLANQRLTGSCPWLFAFDGKSMSFVTDILWKSPLGLRINAQATAGVSQTLDWVKVRGDQLAPRDGFYDLRITAELWETDFFDHVSLMVVDHPENTEVFLDERFSIPQPELKLHVTSPPVPVLRATDQSGADVTETVRAVDGRYLDTFSLGRYQGVAQDHFVEVELPAGSQPRSLLATGWVFPTDSSINVAISQGRQSKPEGLSIEVPDGKGGWKVARKGLGFPAGKYKSVLLDLAGLFSSDGAASQRLRLRTNMEIYWDALAVVSPIESKGKGQPLRAQRIDPETAELRYRGFSQLNNAPRSTPETPDYNHLAGTHQQWLDLVGYYTRFGDVRELLTTVDDRYVIMNAGDEIRLRFKALPAPRAGWKRDFVFVSDGWDKDGNYNTSYSETVLPLPSHNRPAYDTPPGRLEDDPVYLRHSRDWLNLHTRYVDITDLRDALRPSLSGASQRKPAVNQP